MAFPSALAQESLSTSSLGQGHHSGRRERLRGKFTFGRLRSPSSNVDIPSSPNKPATRLPSNDHTSVAPPSPRASCDTSSSALDVQPLPGYNTHFPERRGSLPYSDENIHPYANPDLVLPYSAEPHPKSPLHATLQHSEVPHNDSNSPATESPASTSLPKPMIKSTLTLETPAGPPKRQMSHIQGKDISSPVSVVNPLWHSDSPGHQQNDARQESVPPLPVGTGALPGWMDHSLNPGFSLISLEEARAQRTRTVLAHPPSSDSTSSGESSVTTSFHNTTQETSATFASVFSDSNHSINASTAARSRARSISAGAKAKSALQSFVGPKQPERRGSETGLISTQVPAKDAGISAGGKTIKHKKSGFMRLFGNSGKGNEKEDRVPPMPPPPPSHPLPVSALPEGQAAPVPRHNPKLSSHRIPVPSLSPSLLEVIAQHQGSHAGDSSSASHAPGKPASSPKRTPPPPLSINITSATTGTFAVDPSSRGSRLSAGASDQTHTPQSAPPRISDFPTLKLRPVSTLFSADFGEHIDVTKLNFDDIEIGPKESKEEAARRKDKERPRQDSVASGSASSGPSSASVASFAESSSNLSPVASSYASAIGTALTTPTTGSLMSPVGPMVSPWSRDASGTGGRFSMDQHSVVSSSYPNSNGTTSHVVGDGEASTTIKVLQEHLDNTNKMWRKRVWDLESQVRELKNEVAELKKKRAASEDVAFCDTCGRGSGLNDTQPSQRQQQQGHRSTGSVLNRPRARTGGSARFVNAQL